MKILISGSFWNGSLEESYAQAFEMIGWSVVRFDWEKFVSAIPLANFRVTEKLLRNRLHENVGKQLIERVTCEQPDLVFILKGRHIARNTLQACKRKLGSRPLINFNPDSPWESRNSSERLLQGIPEYDVHFTWNSGLEQNFATAGAKSVKYLPFAYDPQLHFPVIAEQTREFDAVFIGTFDEHRDKLLSKLSGCKIGIWGNGWERARHVPKDWVKSEAIYGEAATRLLSRAGCALNILRPQNAGSHNMRTFEIPATRHLMLTTRSAEQNSFFAEGEEMMCYGDPTELVATIHEINRDPERTSLIALRGYERVREETYVKRAKTILETLGHSI